MIEVIIVTFQRLGYLEKSLACLFLAARQFPSFKYRISILINGKDPATEDYLQEWAQTAPVPIKIHTSETRKTPAAARLQLLKNISACDWIYFADDDAFVPDNFFQSFANLLKEHPDFDVYGGPNLTPLDANRFSVLSGHIMGMRIMTGAVSYRYDRKATLAYCDDRHLILCNLFLRYSRLNDFKLPGHWPGGEENLAIKSLLKAGGHCLYSPNLYVYHERRGDFASFNQQMFKYGVGRGLNLNVPTVTLGLLAAVFLIVLFPFYFLFLCLVLIKPVPPQPQFNLSEYFHKLKILISLYAFYLRGVIVGFTLLYRLENKL